MKQRKKLNRALACLLVLVSLGAALSGCGQKRETSETDVTTKGIDVSKFQEIIDWQQVADSGEVEFAMIRVGYRSEADGTIKEDVTARYNLQEAAAAGIPIGVYFFSTAISEEEAEEEARWTADFIAKYPITYPVVYDCEGFQKMESRLRDLTRTQRTNNALMFLKTIEKLGYEGMFYASKNEMTNERYWETSRIEKKYKIWVAQYPDVPYPASLESTYLGKHYMWQHSTTGSIPGIPQNVDLNIAYFGYDGIEPPKDSEPPYHVAPDVVALMSFDSVNEEVTAKDEVNLRSVPSQGEDSRVLDVLKNGDVALRIAVSASGWSKLEYKGTECYAVTNYLTTDMNYRPGSQNQSQPGDDDGIQTVFTDAKYKVTAKDVVNLRSIPSVTNEEAQVIRQLKNGEYVDCVGVSDNGWSKLKVDGEICYAVSSYLTTLEKIDAPQDEEGIKTMFEDISDRVTPKKEVNLRNIPSTTRKDAEVVMKLKNGDIIDRTGINRDLGWSRVEIDGQTLYCVSNLLEEVK